VTWIGNDSNETTGLTGGTGAARIFAGIMESLDTRPYSVTTPSGYRASWIDFETGLETDQECPNAVRLSLEGGDRPPKAIACGSTESGLGSRLRSWISGALR
jgi:penicillin-binding protein 1B